MIYNLKINYYEIVRIYRNKSYINKFHLYHHNILMIFKMDFLNGFYDKYEVIRFYFDNYLEKNQFLLIIKN